MTGTQAFIACFDDVSRADVARVGGKGANLGELATALLPVPAGFVAIARAERRLLLDAARGR